MSAQREELAPVEVLGMDVGREPGPGVKEAVARCDVLSGGERLLAHFPDASARRVALRSPLDDALDQLAEARARGLRVAVLADGDPLFFGIGARLIGRFGPEGLRFTPGVTAVQAASARLGTPWQGLPVLSLHGRADVGPLLEALSVTGRAAVYTDAQNSPDALARLLLERGLPPESPVRVFERLGLPDERAVCASLAEAATLTFDPLNIAFFQGPEPGGDAALGRPDSSYETQDRLVTKAPVRACTLAALRLTPGCTLWDVGAGSGSVGIEASALVGSGQVWAVEREAARVALIRRNVAACRAWRVAVVQGEAPGALEKLPQPDRIFLGGSLAGGSGALTACCARLAPGGRMVVNTVLLGSLHEALAVFTTVGWSTELMQVAVSLGAPLAGDVRLVPHNPVFILCADKPLQA